MPRDGEPTAPPGAWHLEQGDCTEVMKRWHADGVKLDACVTDPPFHLMSVVKRFGSMKDDTKGVVAERMRARADGAARLARGMMGASWDGAAEGRLPVAFDPITWHAVLQLLKPGGRLLAFGGTRTWHRMACAIEDAGFEIEDSIVWAFGQGLVLRRSRLNPGWSPIIMARAPGPSLDLGIEACRVNGTNPKRWTIPRAGVWKTYGDPEGSKLGESDRGRWPKNLIHDGSPEVLNLFPDAPGQLATARRDGANKGNRVYGVMNHTSDADPEPRGDAGSAARFFNTCSWGEDELQLIYHGKIANKDKIYRCTVCDVPIRHSDMDAHRHEKSNWAHIAAHPTQKPVSLLRHLLRLVAKPGDVVADPFAGSGTTLEAAVLEGVDAMGIEQSGEYVADIRHRMVTKTA